MSIRATKRIIVLEARRVLHNSKLRSKHLMEWHNAQFEPPINAPAFVIELDTEIGKLWASFPTVCDKRPTKDDTP